MRNFNIDNAAHLSYKKPIATTIVTLIIMGMIIPAAFASELVSVEVVAGTANAIIEVHRGDTVNFKINLTATGAETGSATPTDPDYAAINTYYSVDGTTGSSSTPSGWYAFYANLSDPIGGPNYNVIWTGAPDPYEVSATAHASSTTTLGDYTIRIAATFDNPSGGGGKMGDATADYLTIRVLEAAPSNQPPVANADGPYTGNEGSPVSFDGSGSSDTDGTIATYSWDFGDLSAAGTGEKPTHTYADNGEYTVTLTVTDDDGATDTDTTTATIANVAPTVGAITILPSAVVQVNTAITASASFTDPGILDTQTALWDWGDLSTSAGTVTYTTGTSGSGSVGPDSHTYTVAGVYTVVLTVTDKDEDSGTAKFEYVVVYDPSAGFATGGGWIDSPAGAYKADTSLTGKATFGFVSKYLKGATIPTGNTEFQFHAGDLNFKSTSYQWLVVTGGNTAQYKGVGTINGEGTFKFMLWAYDGGAKGADTFRILITDSSDNVVYDNGVQQSISGSIVVHK